MVAETKIEAGFKRPRYFDRQQLRAGDLALEQEYLTRRFRRLARYLHGWGVVCGAKVDPKPEAGAWHVLVGEGYGITPLGDEIYIPENLDPTDLEACIKRACGIAPKDCGSLSTGAGDGGPGAEAPPDHVFLIARPVSATIGAAPGFPADCDHPGNNMQANRVCETASLDVVCELPPVHQPGRIPCEAVRLLICRDLVTTAEAGAEAAPEAEGPALPRVVIPLCPPDVDDEDNYVVLAKLDIGDGRVGGVGYDERRWLFSAELLQRQLECLCEPKEEPTPPPDSVEIIEAKFDPESPATLLPGNRIRVRFRYRASVEARWIVQGWRSDVEEGRSMGNFLLPPGEDAASRELPGLEAGQGYREIIIRAWDDETSRVLAERRFPVSYQYVDLAPSAPPTELPTRAPTGFPTRAPTFIPTGLPTLPPTLGPTLEPTPRPTRLPTTLPTLAPTVGPTIGPTRGPTGRPTGIPTAGPTRLPTSLPSRFPTALPTRFPGGGPPGGGGGIRFGEFLVDERDVREFDFGRGVETPVGALPHLSDAERGALAGAGIGSMMDLFTADPDVLTTGVGMSDVRAAELRSEALDSFRRAAPITLDENEFDIVGGASMPVEDVGNIGSVRGATLRDEGMATVVDVANADSGDLAGRLRVSEGVAGGMIANARDRIRR